MVRLACPVCKTFLHSRREEYLCDQCQKSYDIRNGIVYFNETQHYYGELCQNEMREFLKLSEVCGWREAVSVYLLEKNPKLIRTILDPRRISWISLLNLKGNETALDFGCGLGGVSVQLAKLVGQVVALDGCYDRIRFLQIRRDQEALQNIALVCNGKAHKLPFPDSSFDLIILNMVFPYLAATLPEYDTPSAENTILREISRTLRPGGLLYFTVRNKHCLSRLKSMVLPFRLKPDTDNFNIRGYRYYQRLLLASGMVNIKSFWLLPDYKYPEHFVPLEDDVREIYKQVDEVKPFSALKREITRTLGRVGRLRYLAGTISFVAQRGRDNAR